MSYSKEDLKKRAIVTLSELKGTGSRGSELVLILSTITGLPLLEVVARIKRMAE